MSSYTITTDDPYWAKTLIDLVMLAEDEPITDDTLGSIWSILDELLIDDTIVRPESLSETSDEKRRGFIGKLRRVADNIETASMLLANS